jgi:alanine dehydrogenase
LKLADLGYKRALKDDPGFMKGLNVHLGNLTCKPVAEAQGLEYRPAEL